jgi:transcriptional regulator with XRE-family HTH domain
MNGDRQPVEADFVVGANLRRLRNQHGLTLLELASRLDVNHQQLQKYETGSNRVSAGVLYQIALVFCVPVDVLFEGVDDGSPSDLEAKALLLARSKCRAIVDRASSLTVLDSMEKVLHALKDSE